VKDDLARRSIKFLARLRYLTDLKITRFILRLKGQPRYRLKGQCNRCGACCETPMIQMYWPLFQLRSARWLMRLWHGKINGFVWIGDDKKSHSLIFRCEHWDPETKQCDSYGSRPGMCRDYPRPLLYHPTPGFLEGCGYYAQHKNASNIRARLEGMNLPEGQRKYLEDKLHARSEVDR